MVHNKVLTTRQQTHQRRNLEVDNCIIKVKSLIHRGGKYNNPLIFGNVTQSIQRMGFLKKITY